MDVWNEEDKCLLHKICDQGELFILQNILMQTSEAWRWESGSRAVVLFRCPTLKAEVAEEPGREGGFQTAEILCYAEHHDCSLCAADSDYLHWGHSPPWADFSSCPFAQHTLHSLPLMCLSHPSKCCVYFLQKAQGNILFRSAVDEEPHADQRSPTLPERHHFL